MKLNNFDSYQKLNQIVENKFNNEKNYIYDFFEKKKENLFNKVYFVSTMRDKDIEKIDLKIINLQKLITEQKNSIDFKLADNQITQVDYENLINSDLQKFIENKNKVILKLEQCKERKISKWDKLISKKRKSEKIKINKIDSSLEKVLKTNQEKFNKLKQHFSDKEQEIKELDAKEFAQISAKLEKTKWNLNLQNLKIQSQNNDVGPLTLEKETLVNQNKQNQVINKINKNYKTKALIIGKRKISSNLMTSFTSQKRIKQRVSFGLDQSKLIIIIMLIAIVVGILEPVFFSTRNWKLIFLQNADLACLAIGVTIIILTGGIDLSIGSTLALASALVAKMLVDGYSLGLTILVLVAFCALAGLVSGILVSLIKLQPFIVTLVMMLIWRGATYVLLNNKVVPVQNDTLAKITSIELGGIPLPIIIVAALVLVTFILMKFTVYGRSVYAVGANYKASELSGIKSKMILASVYVTASVCFALGSLLYISRIRVATPTTGNAWELDAIACVVLGGTALTGGKGGILQTVMGWFVMSVLKNALVIVGLDTNVQSIVKGLVILIAIISQSNYGLIKYLNKHVVKIKYKLMTR